MTGGHIEHAVWCTWWTSWTEAHIVRIIVDRCKYFFAGRETIAGHTIFRIDFSFECQRQQTAQILVVHVQRGVFGDVRWEDGTIGAVQMVTGRCAPMWQIFFAIVFVDDAEFCDVIDASEDCHTILQRRSKGEEEEEEQRIYERECVYNRVRHSIDNCMLIESFSLNGIEWNQQQQ